MLYKSGVNLELGAQKFIENNEEITLFSAYLKLNEFEELNFNKKVKRIIVRWEIEDLYVGVSDIELYDYCLKNNIALYRNTRIHLKTFWNNAEGVLFGSANITGRGIGEKGNYNYELNGVKNHIGYSDIAYFNKIILDSEYITPELFNEIKELVDKIEAPLISYPKLHTKKSIADDFLLSSLPMTETVDRLYEAYCNPKDLNTEEMNYVSHDIELYKIPDNLTKIEFYEYTKLAFNEHPFIVRLKKVIESSSRQSLNYGSVVRWIQSNTTTVPTPRSWELKKKQIINILYSWICDLDHNFQWSTPNYSQVLYFKPSENRVDMEKKYQWLPSNEAKTYLNISDCKLMHLREEGELEYKKKGNTFIYKIEHTK